MKLLIIEDFEPKYNQLIQFLGEEFPSATYKKCISYNSGLRELILHHQDYDFLLLDISMPNYDLSAEESGGEFIPLAGKLILKELLLRDIPMKAVVVTMHGSFADGINLSDLDVQFRTEFNQNYLGYVYFTPVSDEWKTRLSELLNRYKT